MIRTLAGNVIQNPLVGTANRAMADMVKYAVEFGLTPSARARIAAGPRPQEASKFDGRNRERADRVIRFRSSRLILS
jgi:phage terminase small subunit